MQSEIFQSCWVFRKNKYFPLHWGIEEKELNKGLSVIVCTYKRAESMARFLTSLAESVSPLPDELIIVDASPDDAAERRVRQALKEGHLAKQAKYVRVSEGQRGLTRQRNLAIKLVEADLACFFDDDILLRPNVLRYLEEAMRADERLIAAACHIENEIIQTLPWRWRIRKWLGLWAPSDIGYLSRAGMAIPQGLLAPFEGIRKVDIVPGCATCWRTCVLKSTPFDENFVGYGQAEDVEYSLRTRKLGPKVIVGGARVLHLHDQAGRISPFEYGRQTGRNVCLIYRRYGNLNQRKVLRFAVWQFLDILMLTASGNFRQAAGRCVGLMEHILKKI